VASAPPLAAAGIVFLLGGLLLGASAVRQPWPRRVQAGRAALAGTVMLVGGQGLATVALTRMTVGLVTVLAATIPLWIVVLQRLRGTSVGRGAGLRCAAGFAGIVLVIATAPRAAFSGSIWALVASCVAPVLWAAGSLLSAAPGAMPQSPRVAGAIQLTAGGVALLALAALTGQMSSAAWSGLTGGSIAAGVALLLLDSIGGFTLYTRLLRVASPQLVSTYAYVTPLVAISIGTIALGEPLWLGAIVGAAIVLATIVLEVRAHR
jgi:drug/metabolite transporter (DMT)-like permease